MALIASIKAGESALFDLFLTRLFWLATEANKFGINALTNAGTNCLQNYNCMIHVSHPGR
jgi:hypothetical protein